MADVSADFEEEYKSTETHKPSTTNGKMKRAGSDTEPKSSPENQPYGPSKGANVKKHENQGEMMGEEAVQNNG
jgi:hypothetical protein